VIQSLWLLSILIIIIMVIIIIIMVIIIMAAQSFIQVIHSFNVMLVSPTSITNP